MARKAKSKSPESRIEVEIENGEDEGLAVVKTVLGPNVRHALAIQQVNTKTFGEAEGAPSFVDYTRGINDFADQAEHGESPVRQQDTCRASGDAGQYIHRDGAPHGDQHGRVYGCDGNLWAHCHEGSGAKPGDTGCAGETAPAARTDCAPCSCKRGRTGHRCRSIPPSCRGTGKWTNLRSTPRARLMQPDAA